MNRPGTCSITRCVWPSSANDRPVAVTVMSARAAAACTVMSGPGRRASSRKSRAARGDRFRQDHEKTLRMSSAESGPTNPLNGPVSRMCCATDVIVKPRWVASRAATTARASGNRPQSAVMSRTVCGSAANRGAEPIGQQRPCVLLVQDAQVHRASTLVRHQSQQLVAAGDQDEAVRRAGEQRSDLVGVQRVVEDDEHTPAGQNTAVERGLALRVPGMCCGMTPNPHRKPRRTLRLSGGWEGSKPRRST